MTSVPEHSVDRVLSIPLYDGGQRRARVACQCGWQTDWVADDEPAEAAQRQAAVAHGLDVGADVFAEGHRRITHAIAFLLEYGLKRQIAAGTVVPAPAPPAPKPKRRAPRPSPSRLAKWEAAWQAEADAEGDS